MRKSPRQRRVLGAATLMVVAAPALAHAAHVPPADTTAQRAALEARVAAVREALKALPADTAGPSWTLAQATNWSNWPKWSKWSNWANK